MRLEIVSSFCVLVAAADCRAAERSLASYVARDVDVALTASGLGRPAPATAGGTSRGLLGFSSEDVVAFLVRDMGDDDRAQARAALERILRAVGLVDWDAALGREFLIAGRFGFPPELLLLFRAPRAEIDSRFAELGRVLDELEGLAPDVLRVTRTAVDDVRTARLTLAALPVGISIAAASDVVCVSTSPCLFADFVERTSADKEDALAQSDRFRRILARAGRARLADCAVVDGRAACAFFAEFAALTTLAQGADAASPADTRASHVLAAAFARIDSIVVSWEERAGAWEVAAAVTYHGTSGPLEELFAGCTSPERLLAFVPGASPWFVAIGELSWPRLQAALAPAADEGGASGAAWSDRLAALQAFAGGGVAALVPADGGAAGVVGVFPHRGGAPPSLVAGGTAALEEFLAARGQRLVVADVPGGGGRFHRAGLAALPDWRCVYGQVGEHAFVASSFAPVVAAYETYRGMTPDARARHAALHGASPPGLVCEAWCEDVRAALLAAAERLAPFLVAGALFPPDPPYDSLVRAATLGSRAVEALRRRATSFSVHLRVWYERHGRHLRARLRWRSLD